MKFDYLKLFFDVQSNTNVSADFEPAISIDHTQRIFDNIDTLRRAMGITNLQPMNAGTQIKIYKYTVTKAASQVDEGDVIGLSKVERKLDRTLTLDLNKYRRLTTAEAIQKSGRDIAIDESDTKLEAEIRKDVRNDFFALIKAAPSSAAGGSGLQAAAAQLWASLNVYYEDKDVTPIFFVNPLDVATYLGSASITTQTAFGFSYIEGFCGMGNAFVTPQVPQGSLYGTVTENLNGAYIPQSGDIADAFDLTYDESGLVGMTHSRADDRASIQTLIMLGVLFYAEDVSGVFKSYIGDGPTRVELDKHTATVTAAAGDSHTVSLTATKVPNTASVTWSSSDTSKATVSNGTVTGVAAGTATITAKITVNSVDYTDTCVVTVT